MTPVSMWSGVVVLSGPPGCGKSTLAEHISKVSGAAVANWDWLMSGLRDFAEVWATVEADAELRRDVGYSLMCRVGELQLRRGHGIIFDVITRPRALALFSALASRYETPLSVIECCCSDRAVHEARIVGRRRNIPGWDELEWHWVENSISIYEELPEPKLVVDAVAPLDANIARVEAYLGLRPSRRA